MQAGVSPSPGPWFQERVSFLKIQGLAEHFYCSALSALPYTKIQALLTEHNSAACFYWSLLSTAIYKVVKRRAFAVHFFHSRSGDNKSEMKNSHDVVFQNKVLQEYFAWQVGRLASDNVTCFDCEIRCARTFDQGQGGRGGKQRNVIIIAIVIRNHD